MSITSFADRPSSAPMIEQLLHYLSALPDSRDIESLLRLTLQTALGLAGTASGAAIATGELHARVSAGPEEEAIWPVLLTHLPPSSPSGDPPPAMEQSIWSTDSEVGPLLICSLNADGYLHGLVAFRRGADVPQGLEDSLLVMGRAAGSMLGLMRGLVRTQHRLAELQLINEVTAVTGSTLELKSLLELVVRLTQTALRSEACTLMMVDDNTDELVFEIPTGKAGDALQQMRIPRDQGIAGWVATRGEAALSNDVHADKRFNIGVDEGSGFITRNVLAVPLQARGKVIGVLEVLNKFGDKVYTDHDLALLTTLAGQVAVALDNARLFTSLQQQHERLLAAEEQVRKELARDLHDGPAQQLAAIVMGLEILRKAMQRDPDRVEAELVSLEAIAKKANRQVRTLQFQLRPVVLETRGLRAAVEYYVTQLQETTNVRLTVAAEGCTARLPAVVERAAFDIVQEALGNVRKHSGASAATVVMREVPGYWRLDVRDNGKGFDVAATMRAYELRGSLGMINMRERAQAIGGDININATPGQGTTVSLLLPAALKAD